MECHPSGPPASLIRAMAANFAKAIGGNVVLYAALGVLVFGVKIAVRKGPADVLVRLPGKPWGVSAGAQQRFS